MTTLSTADFHYYDWRTFKKWLKPFEQKLGKKEGRYYKIPQVRVIFKKLELPCSIDTDSDITV